MYTQKHLYKLYYLLLFLSLLAFLTCLSSPDFRSPAIFHTSLVVCTDVVATGFCSLFIELCDIYIFYNRLLAVTKMSTWKKHFTYFYIYVVIIGPYYSSYAWLALFYDLNSNNYIVTTYLTALNAWSNIAYNLWFTFEFVYILYNIYGGKKNTSGTSDRKIQSVVIKSLCHFVTSTIANLMYIYYYYFLPDSLTFSFFYNITICAGLHFFFNVKIDRLITIAFPMKFKIISQAVSQNVNASEFDKDDNNNSSSKDNNSSKNMSKYSISNKFTKRVGLTAKATKSRSSKSVNASQVVASFD